jgi:subtilisin family serine protease
MGSVPRIRRPGVLRTVWAAALVAATVAGVGGGTPASARPGDGEPFIDQQWGLRQIGAIDAWALTRGAGVRVGVVDTGIDLAHEELGSGTVVASTRCIGTDGQTSRCTGSAQDDNGHGTHVAGTIAAPLNGKGIAGVAPEAKLLVVKALDAQGGGEAVDVAAAIDWLVARDVQVINLSLADATAVGQVIGSPIETSIRRAFRDRGVVFVLAGGNKPEDGSTPPGTKGGYGDLPALVVEATGPEGNPARYNVPLGSAKWGLAAPGGDGSLSAPEREIVSTYWYAKTPNGYAYSEGTSMAAPHVAGAAALLAGQGVRGQAAVDRILATLRPLACGTGCRGALDARVAVGAPVSPPPAPSTTAKAPVSKQARPAPPRAAAPPVTGATSVPTEVVTAPVSDPVPAAVALPGPATPAAPTAEDVPVVGTDETTRRPVGASVMAAALLAAVSAATLRTAVRRRVRAAGGR